MNQTKLWVLRGMMMLASLFTLNANAINIPITSLTCTQVKTATASCVQGYYASGWTGTPATTYWQYSLNTVGYTGVITMDFNTLRSSTGPTTGQIWYSLDGGATETLLTAGSGGTFTVGTTCATKIATLPATCSGLSNLVVRIRLSGATASGGTHRVDSINVFDAASTSCNATPVAGTVSGASSICGDSSTVLTLTGASGGAGITYQWQSSPNNATWTNIPGATGLSYTTPGLTATTYYRVVVTCAGFGSATTASKTLTVNTVSVAPITGYTAPLIIGTPQTLSNATAGGVWSSTNTSVATVNGSGALNGVFGGNATIIYKVTNVGTGCVGSSIASVNVVWPNTLALYAGQGGTSTSVINVPGDAVSTLYATGFGTATPCGSGGLSGITVPVTTTTFNTSNPHVGYKVYPTAGNALNMFRIHARARVSSTGPKKARIAYQYWSNGLPSGWQVEANDVTLVSGNCGASANSWDFNSGIPANPNPTANGITDSLEVAVFPFAPDTTTGTFQLNALEVYGMVTTNADCNAGTIATTADSVLPAIVNICDSGARFLNYNVGNGGIAGVNIIYQWQRSTDGINWSDIVDANGVVYQTPDFHAGVDPDTNFYRVQITCDATSDVSYSASNIVTVNPAPANAGVISGGITPSAQFPMKHMLIGTTYPMTSTIAGGTWSSNDTSSISFGGTNTATPNIPGDAIITYRISVGGCTATTKDTFAAYYPGTKALYIGKGGNSLNLYAASGVTASNLALNNWDSATACGSGGISGLVNTTAVQDAATNGSVSTMVVSTGAPFTANSIRATVRKQPSGTYKAYLGFRPATGGAWTSLSTPVDVETDDCGYSHSVITFPISTSVTATGTEFAIFGYNGTSTTTLQVNSISILGTGTQLINGSTGLDMVNKGSDVQLFPNPATNVLNVTATEKVNVIIMSIDGKKLIEQKDAKHINVSNLVSGMYLIQVYGESNNLLKAEKFVKK